MEGETATVEVYTRAHRVELFINGKRVAAKRRGRDCRIIFKTPFIPGELRAVAYDGRGQTVASASLHTAGSETRLTLVPETASAAPGDLCYVRLRYTDDNGELKPLVRGRISVRVENGALLALGHACPYNPDGFLGDTTDTYYGEALAIVRTTGGGDVRVLASSPFGSAQAAIAWLGGDAR